MTRNKCILWIWIYWLLAALIVAQTAAVMGSIQAFSTLSTPVTADAAIVLGAAVWRGQPSPVFRERINHAIELYQDGQVQNIIFTGGQGAGDDQAESEVARLYAIARGIPEDVIYIETLSTTTYGNLREADKLAEQHSMHCVLVVSDPLHMKRAVTMAQDLGLEAYPSPTTTSRYQSLYTQLTFLIRETFTYVLYLLQTGFSTAGGLNM